MVGGIRVAWSGWRSIVVGVAGVVLSVVHTQIACGAVRGDETGVVAEQDTVLPSSADHSQIEALAQSSAWHALLYYRDGIIGVESEADDPAFFLSANGKYDPLGELAASLTAFAAPEPQGDLHPQCRFPARYHWLKSTMPNVLGQAPVQACTDLEAFVARLGAKAVTMVYPVPNMDDVSTLFGHSFLRLDRDPSPEVDKLDDYTLNFAALVKNGYDQSDLVTKGLSGDLEGIFTVLPYRKKLKEYLRMEARDVWEYRLNLTQAETDQLVRHAWEVRTVHFEYEFFMENCSYRMLNYLDIARPGMDMHENYSVYVIPMDAVEAVIDANLVDNVHYQASDQSRWLAVADRLIDAEIELFRSGTLERTRMAPVSAVVRPLEPGKVGHFSGRVRLSGGQREGLNVAILGLRPAYHDFLDAPTGGPLAEISVFALTIRQIEQQSVELEDLTFFGASSLKPRNVLYSPWSWQLATGVTGMRWLPEKTDIEIADDSSVDLADNEEAKYLLALENSDWINPLYARLLVGPAWGSDNFALYQLLGLEVQMAGEFDSGANALAIWNPGVVARSEDWQAQLDVQVKSPSEPVLETYGEASASLTRRLSSNVALFLRGLREKDVLGWQSEAQLGASFYF